MLPSCSSNLTCIHPVNPSPHSTTLVVIPSLVDETYPAQAQALPEVPLPPLAQNSIHPIELEFLNELVAQSIDLLTKVRDYLD